MSKIKGKFCERTATPARAFAPDSLRWTKKGRNWLLTGCPRGKWNGAAETCSVGTRVHKVLTKRGPKTKCTTGATGVFGRTGTGEIPIGKKIRANTNVICAPEKFNRAITMCMRRTGKAPSFPLSHSGAVCTYVQGVGAADRESFYALHLDIRNRVVGSEEIAKGSLAEVSVNPREVFKSAILSNAGRMIIAHNHPSGDPTPSREDIALTKRLNAMGNALAIPILDHVVVGSHGKCHSIRESDSFAVNGTVSYPSDFGG